MSSTLLGCSLSFTDHAQTNQPARVSTAGTGCLEGAFRTIEDYPTGKATTDQVNGAWSCGVRALDSFVNLAQGKDPSFFTATSLRTFLEQKFLDKTKISDSLLNEVMLLKQVILGGESDRLTRDEILRARALFLALQTESVNILPHIRILTMKDSPEDVHHQPERVEAALKQLALTSSHLGGLVAKASAPYDLGHIEGLLNELQAIYSQSSGWDGPNWLIANLPIIYHAKAFLVRPEGEVVAPDEWSALFIRGSELYGISLRLHYLMYHEELLSGSGLDQLQLTIESALETLHESVLAKQDKRISYDLLDPLVDDVIRLKIIDWRVRASTWKAVMRAAFEKILNPPDRNGKRIHRGGITEQGFIQARKEAEGWLQTQKDWGALTRQAAERDSRFLSEAIPLTMVSEIWPEIASKAPLQHEDLNRLFQRQFPIDYSPEGTVIFERDRSKVWVDQAMFNSINWKQSLIRAAIMGYSANPEMARYKGLNLDEFHNLYIDGKALGVDLGFLDPNDDKVWASLFTELSIFTLSSDGGTGDGSHYVSYFEAVDFISNAVSSAKSSHLFYAELLANCQHFSPDEYGVPRWSAACYRERFKKSFSSFYRYFPQWVKMVSTYSPSEMDTFQTDFEKAARKLGVSEQLVESTDVDRGTMIMHYIESLYTRFDVDQNGTLNPTEAAKAFPLLRDLLADAAKSQDDGMLLSVYMYLMKYGAPPTSLPEKLYFEFYWKNSPGRWHFEADRHQLLRIVANLNSTAGH